MIEKNKLNYKLPEELNYLASDVNALVLLTQKFPERKHFRKKVAYDLSQPELVLVHTVVKIAEDYYSIKENDKLGTGAQGSVRKAYLFKKINGSFEFVAIRALKSSRKPDKEEAEFVSRYHGSYGYTTAIPRISSKTFIDQPYFSGEDLKNVLEKKQLEWRQKLAITIYFLTELQRMHDLGIVHNDLKPSNLMCDLEGATKIIDLGSASINQYFQDDHIQSFAYSPPETFYILFGEIGPIKHDSYSAGLILKEIFSNNQSNNRQDVMAIIKKLCCFNLFSRPSAKKALNFFMDVLTSEDARYLRERIISLQTGLITALNALKALLDSSALSLSKYGLCKELYSDLDGKLTKIFHILQFVNPTLDDFKNIKKEISAVFKKDKYKILYHESTVKDKILNKLYSSSSFIKGVLTEDKAKKRYGFFASSLCKDILHIKESINSTAAQQFQSALMGML